MKILQLVEESPSLDFTVPIFEFLDKEDKILVYSTKSSYEHWYDHDPINLLVNNKKVDFSTVIDSTKLSSFFKRILKLGTKNNRDNINNFFHRIINKLFNEIIDITSEPIDFFEDYFDGLPDLILIETRNDLKPNRVNKKIFNWINKNLIKTIGVPVSSYTLEGVKWSPIEPFGKSNLGYKPFNDFPKNYEYWLASKQPFVIEQLKETPHKIVGYPGVDSKWLNLFKYDHVGKNSSNEVNILLNIRHFGQKRNLEPAKGKYVYEDVFNFFYTLKTYIDSLDGIKVNLFIKPHYYVNFKSFEEIFNKLEIKNYEFLRTSIYNSLMNINFVIGLHSSVNLISTLAGIPTLLFPQVLTEKFKNEDSKTKTIYEGLQGYCKNEDEFKLKFELFLDKEKREEMLQKDKKHLRGFFEDGTIEDIKKYLISLA